MLRCKQNVFLKGLLSFAGAFPIALFLSDFIDGLWSLHYWNVAIATGVTFLIAKQTDFRAKFNIKTFLIIWLLSIFHQTVTWGIKTFPLEDPQLVILTLQMPLDGFTFIFIKSYVLKVLLSCLFTSFFISILIEPWISSVKRKKIILASAIVLISAFNALTVYDNIPINMYKEYLSDDNLVLHESSFFQENYTCIDSVAIKKETSETKNLILIIMESIENSFVDSASGGNQSTNLMPELLPADSNEYHFSGNGHIGGGYNTVGAQNTISATISKTTGVPVLLRRNFSDTLLEKVSSIYDIIQKNGYYNVFIQGTDATFSGTKNFVLSHGINALYDMHILNKQQDIEEKYRNFRTFEAGITDRSILDISKHILDTLSKKQHFSLTIATIETHFPYGFYNKNCEDKPYNNSEQASLEATIKCASKDIRSFINWIKQQPFYPNTEIIIVGDHLFMGDYLVSKDSSDRRWYDLFIGPAIKPTNTKREFTSFDIAPTILETLGFTIENHKMGFGVSLFSEESTLVEKIGIDFLNKELTDMQKSVEYNELLHPVNIIPSI